MFESTVLCEMFTQESCIAALWLIKETRKTSDDSWFLTRKEPKRQWVCVTLARQLKDDATSCVVVDVCQSTVIIIGERWSWSRLRIPKKVFWGFRKVGSKTWKNCCWKILEVSKAFLFLMKFWSVTSSEKEKKHWWCFATVVKKVKSGVADGSQMVYSWRSSPNSSNTSNMICVVGFNWRNVEGISLVFARPCWAFRRSDSEIIQVEDVWLTTLSETKLRLFWLLKRMIQILVVKTLKAQLELVSV